MIKIGSLLYRMTLRCSKILFKYKLLYWILSFTWGILGTLFGFIMMLVMYIVSGHIEVYHRHLVVKHGYGWGGLECGIGFICCNDVSEHCKKHESGHNYQNAILGPFVIFLVFIPSMIRYHYRNLKEKKGIKLTTNYDDIWFEKSASDIGEEIYK